MLSREMVGLRLTATVRTGKHPVVVDRKIKFLVKELKCFRMGVVCISETKWFGSDVYEADGFTVLHSGRDLPQPGDMLQHGEGVTVVLDPAMTQAWHDAGESWLAVNSRIVSVRLQFSGKYPSGSQQFVPIVSVCAPTHRPPAEAKEAFYDDLQAVINLVPSSDMLLVMGDFNARVGCVSNSESGMEYKECLVLVKSMRVVNCYFPSVH